LVFDCKQNGENINFHLCGGNGFTNLEQEKVLLLGLISDPEAILRVRTYIGLKDEQHFAKEIAEIKQKYGNLKNSLKNANPEDFRKKGCKKVCQELVNLKQVLEKYKNNMNIDLVLNDLFPIDSPNLNDIRGIILSLKTEEDSLKSLYLKLVGAVDILL